MMTLLNLVFNFTNVTFTQTYQYICSPYKVRGKLLYYLFILAYLIIIDKSDHEDTGGENEGSEKNEDETSEKDDKEKMFTFYRLSMYMNLIFI